MPAEAGIQPVALDARFRGHDNRAEGAISAYFASRHIGHSVGPLGILISPVTSKPKLL